jgi:hypothetical protein
MKKTRAFKDPELLREMLTFRRHGITYDQLAELYRVDRSTIKHHCVANGLGRNVINIVKQYYKQVGIILGANPTIIVELVEEPESMWVDDEIEGRICTGKSYAEYLAESQKSNPTSQHCKY